MAGHLARAGSNLTVWNRTTAKAEPVHDLGAKIASSPEQLAASCDLVFLCLSRTQDVGESLVKELIPVLDNFERSIAAARRGSSTEAIIDGVTAVEKSLRRALEQYGLKRIESVGNPFDPEIHEAIATVETADYPADTVTDELEAGYVLAERVVRPARVRVSSSTGKED